MNIAMKSVLRAHGWQDLPCPVPLDIHQASALKWLGRRWGQRALEKAGFEAEFALINMNAPDGAEIAVGLTPRRVIVALAFAETERIAVTDPDFWMGDLRSGLDSLITHLEAVRETLAF